MGYFSVTSCHLANLCPAKGWPGPNNYAHTWAVLPGGQASDVKVSRSFVPPPPRDSKPWRGLLSSRRGDGNSGKLPPSPCHKNTVCSFPRAAERKGHFLSQNSGGQGPEVKMSARPGSLQSLQGGPSAPSRPAPDGPWLVALTALSASVFSSAL